MSSFVCRIPQEHYVSHILEEESVTRAIRAAKILPPVVFRAFAALALALRLLGVRILYWLFTP